MKVALAGGGTGGHLFPALAVAEVLQERGHEVLVFISEKEIDALATRDRTEFRFEKLPGVGMPRGVSLALIGFLKRLVDGYGACAAVLKRFQPDAVLGMGGFTSTAPILAGKRRRVPVFLHESNAIPGKANRLNARLADVVFLGFEACQRHLPRARCVVTGTPLRKALQRVLPRQAARQALGLQAERRTVLVMGGSQGAQGINRAVIEALPDLAALDVQIIHLTGMQDEQVMAVNYRRHGVPAHVAAFSHQMELLYSAADLAVARAGAASLAELSWFGLPAVLIPYPFAAENHQARNAEIFEKAGAATVLEQTAMTGRRLVETLRALLEQPAVLRSMSEKMRAQTAGDAALRIVQTMETCHPS